MCCVAIQHNIECASSLVTWGKQTCDSKRALRKNAHCLFGMLPLTIMEEGKLKRQQPDFLKAHRTEQLHNLYGGQFYTLSRCFNAAKAHRCEQALRVVKTLWSRFIKAEIKLSFCPYQINQIYLISAKKLKGETWKVAISSNFSAHFLFSSFNESFPLIFILVGSISWLSNGISFFKAIVFAKKTSSDGHTIPVIWGSKPQNLTKTRQCSRVTAHIM